MTFIITLVSLVLERFFYWGHLRHWRWFSYYQRRLQRSYFNNWSVWLLLIMCVLPPVILIGFFQWLFHGWLYGLFELLFGIVILLYCLGPHNFWLQAYAAINEIRNDDPALATARVRELFGIATPENPQAFHQSFTGALFLAAYWRIFSVAFWFVILGPIGAILYRMIALLSTESPLGLTYVASKTQQWLDWMPIRIFTFIFALGGHFKAVFIRWKRTILSGPEANELLLTDCGTAALDITENTTLPENGALEKEAIHLLDRVFIISLVILAVVVLLT